MDFTFFTTPTGIAVIATGGSFFAGLVGAGISSWTIQRTHRQRLTADENLAERKFKFDKQLTADKQKADIALAEKKFQLDARQADRKRRQELAEDLLSGFYQIRDVIRSVRAPISYQEEGAARKPRDSESEGVARLRNTYYVPLARLEARRADIAALLAKRYRAAAWFGAAAEEPFQDIHEVLTKIATASEMLIDGIDDGTREAEPALWREMQGYIWARAVNPDPIDLKITAAITKIEGICRGVLEAQSA